MLRQQTMLEIAGSLFIAASALGCGASSATGDSAAGGKATAGPPNLAGHYESACLGPANGSYDKLVFDLMQADWRVDYTVYGDAACTVALGTVHIEGPYEQSAPSATVQGAYEARFGFTSKTVTPHAQAFADFLGSAKGCGGGTFPLEKATDVFEKGCAGLGQYPKSACTADYDLAKLDAASLRFGKRPADNNLCAPDKRPTELNPDAFMKR